MTMLTPQQPVMQLNDFSRKYLERFGSTSNAGQILGYSVINGVCAFLAREPPISRKNALNVEMNDVYRACQVSLNVQQLESNIEGIVQACSEPARTVFFENLRTNTAFPKNHSDLLSHLVEAYSHNKNYEATTINFGTHLIQQAMQTRYVTTKSAMLNDQKMIERSLSMAAGARFL